MEQKKQEPIRDARQLGTAKMLILGLQHMFAMFGATILVPILVSGYFQKACGEPLTRGLSVSVTLFCAGFGTLIFHLCTKFKVPAFLGSSFAFLGGFRRILNRNRSPGLVGKDVYDDLVYHLLQLIKESTGLISSPLDLTKLLLPKTRQLRAFQQFLMDRADQFRTGSGGIKILALLPYIITLEQGLNDRRTGRRAADTVFL